MEPPSSAPHELLKKLTTVELVGGIHCHICKFTFGDKKKYDDHYLNHCSARVDIVYTCVKCLKDFTEYPKFRGHCYTRHVMKDRFKCVHCNKFFSKQSALNIHNDAVHLFRCSICRKEFSEKRELNLHEFIHKNENPPYKCLFCEQEIMNSSQCEDHIDQHTEISYSCLICDKSIESKQKASEHLFIHFDYMKQEPENDVEDDPTLTDSSINAVGGILCVYCDGLYKNRVEFLSHLNSEHSDKPEVFSCGVCLRNFSEYHLFGRHAYHHVAKDRFQCEVCFKNFDRNSRLVLHMEAFHTSAGEKPFSCTHCSRAFQTEMRLRQHLRKLHNTFSVTCQQEGCGQVFSTPKDLMLHSKIHKNTENRCRFCGLQFISLSACLRHLDLHCKTVFSCPVCDKKYGEKYLLKKHMIKHFEAVIHMCKVCGKTFNSRHRLAQHSKTHTNTSKTHTCSYCGKSFTRLAILQQHINIHSGLRPYKCIQCQKTFASYPNWSKHMRKIHNFEGKLRDLQITELVAQNMSEKCKDINASDGKLDVVEQKPLIQLAKKIESVDMSPEQFLDDRDTMNVCDTDNFIELHNVMRDDWMTFDSAANLKHDPPRACLQCPPEYGPEFPLFTGEALDDYILPHINPHLATNTHFDYSYTAV